MVNKHLRTLTAAVAVLTLALVGCDDDNGLDDGLNGDDPIDGTNDVDGDLDDDA